jgi:light-regulated signal transduction histidine kinase (bacteriophytochrome)
MDGVQELHSELSAEPAAESGSRIQPCAYLLELSPDWIVLRASENIHHLLRESHVTLVGEPLGHFVHAQPLHDLRNVFARLSATTGIGRAYGVRLTDDPDLVDIAFQLSGGRVVLEAVPSSTAFGECFGSIGGLVAGLAQSRGQALLDNGARRMRALTGYDCVSLRLGEMRAESSRGGSAAAALGDDLPLFIGDCEATPVGVYPRKSEDSAIDAAVMRAPGDRARDAFRAAGIRASLRVPFRAGDAQGEFRCDSRTPRVPGFELHAAAELFAQLFAMRLEIDRLRTA